MEDIIKKEIDTLFSRIKIDSEYDIEIEKVEEVLNIKVSFSGERLGYLIGNHGRHLDSLQYVISLILRKKLEEETNFRVIVDVGGYKEERNKNIEKMAMQKADDARILGEPLELPPMSASDRRVIHIALQTFDDIKTESVGEGRDRRIQIIPLKEDNQETEESEESEE
jgi:spoIIIJ-associated protein